VLFSMSTLGSVILLPICISFPLHLKAREFHGPDGRIHLSFREVHLEMSMFLFLMKSFHDRSRLFITFRSLPKGGAYFCLLGFHGTIIFLTFATS
jgi:hypothetical protein